MLDPQLRELLTRTADAPDFADLSAQDGRALYRALLTNLDLRELADVDMQVRQIDGPGGALPVRVYRPKTAATGPRGLVVYLHGGGFVVGEAASYDPLLRRLCADADAVIAAVDYRLAPEHPFPAAVDDARATLRWAFEHAAELGAEPTRVAVAGDSAGGNLSAGLALWARDEGWPLRCQVLLYPVVARRPGDFPSYDRYGTGYVLSRRAVDHFVRCYFGSAGVAPDWRGAPLIADSVAGVAPAVVLVAGHDVLRDEGIAYAERLCEAGVQATLVEYSGLAHGFISMGGVLAAARLAIGQVAVALRDGLRC